MSDDTAQPIVGLPALAKVFNDAEVAMHEALGKAVPSPAIARAATPLIKAKLETSIVPRAPHLDPECSGCDNHRARAQAMHRRAQKAEGLVARVHSMSHEPKETPRATARAMLDEMEATWDESVEECIELDALLRKTRAERDEARAWAFVRDPVSAEVGEYSPSDGAEAEDLRQELEAIQFESLDDANAVQVVLDRVRARDSLRWVVLQDVKLATTESERDEWKRVAEDARAGNEKASAQLKDIAMGLAVLGVLLFLAGALTGALVSGATP